MDNFKFVVGPSPHVNKIEDSSKIMFWVIGSLLPVTVGAVYLLGLKALLVIVMAIVGCVVTEAVLVAISKMPMTIFDGSALLTGLLLGLTLPPRAPFWIPLAGGFIAICFGKFLFGGLGHNIFNPALVGRAILFLSWPEAGLMTKSWIITNATSSATFLAQAKGTEAIKTVSLNYGQAIQGFLFANRGASIGEVSAILLLIGAIILLAKKIIDWRIPFTYIGTVALLTFIMHKDPIFYVLAGGLILGAFFMATDYVTSPITPNGKIIFGVGLGIVTIVIRYFSNLPEGVMFSILFMNMMAPLIEKYTRPRVMGTVKKAAVLARPAQQEEA
jgi:electron transport complex protein RnfD